MLFRQLFDATSSTYSYLLACTRTGEAVFIDTVFEQHARDVALVRELDLSLVACVETHVHADHVTGAWLLHSVLGTDIIVSAASGAEGAHHVVGEGDAVAFGDHRLEVRTTPGHTDGCVTYVLADQGMAFTGDALLIRGAGRTDFQQGSAERLYSSIREKIFSLPDDFLLYPAHDYRGRTVTTVSEEKRHNPRIGGDADMGDFVGFMDNLHLPHPKAIDVAVPGNMVVGKPDGDLPAPASWGPAYLTYGGVLEIDPEWVALHADAVHILDVREPQEWDGELGRIEGATLISLGDVPAQVDAIRRAAAGKPVVSVCRSGRRSARATTILEKAGLGDAANLAGGMIRWRTLGLPHSDTQTS